MRGKDLIAPPLINKILTNYLIYPILDYRAISLEKIANFPYERCGMYNL